MSKFKMLHITSLVIIILGLVIGAFGFRSIIKNEKARSGEDDSVSSSGGFDIVGFDVVLDVDSKKSIDVHEHITTDFYWDDCHGIYRFIPEWLEYTAKDGVARSQKAIISNLRAENQQYSLDTIKGKQRIKIGNPNKYLDEGINEFDICYTYDMGADTYEGFDELIFHAFGDYWGTPIEGGTITVNFPKDIPEDAVIHFYEGKRRNMEFTDDVDYTIEGKTLSAILPPEEWYFDAVTVDVELPEGYFEAGANNYGMGSFVRCIICIAIACVIFVLWCVFGKDYREYPQGMEFYPPNNFDAAQVGYIYKKTSGKKLTIALVVELAAKGYISIKESKDKKKRTIKREKGRDDKLTANELLVYKQLFKRGSSTDLATNKHFYEVFAEIDKSVREEFDDVINDLTSAKVKIVSSVLFVASIITFINAYCRVEDLDPKYSYMYFIAVVSIIITLIFTIFMDRKNKYGEELVTRVKDFKAYLEEDERLKIDELVESNPNYFYDILPYAYVLDVSKKWISKFKVMEIDENTYPYYIDDMYTSVYYPKETYSFSSSGECSSCGGGCSSCGGGCSSCGGGGSW